MTFAAKTRTLQVTANGTHHHNLSRQKQNLTRTKNNFFFSPFHFSNMPFFWPKPWFFTSRQLRLIQQRQFSSPSRPQRTVWQCVFMWVFVSSSLWESHFSRVWDIIGASHYLAQDSLHSFVHWLGDKFLLVSLAWDRKISMSDWGLQKIHQLFETDGWYQVLAVKFNVH